MSEHSTSSSNTPPAKTPAEGNQQVSTNDVMNLLSNLVQSAQKNQRPQPVPLARDHLFNLTSFNDASQMYSLTRLFYECIAEILRGARRGDQSAAQYKAHIHCLQALVAEAQYQRNLAPSLDHDADLFTTGANRSFISPAWFRLNRAMSPEDPLPEQKLTPLALEEKIDLQNVELRRLRQRVQELEREKAQAQRADRGRQPYHHNHQRNY